MQIDELKAERNRLRYKQRQMAEKLGISLAAYNSKENGKSSFTDDEKKTISQMLHFTPYQMNKILYDGLLPIGPDGLLTIEEER